MHFVGDYFQQGIKAPIRQSAFLEPGAAFFVIAFDESVLIAVFALLSTPIFPLSAPCVFAGVLETNFNSEHKRCDVVCLFPYDFHKHTYHNLNRGPTAGLEGN